MTKLLGECGDFPVNSLKADAKCRTRGFFLAPTQQGGRAEMSGYLSRYVQGRLGWAVIGDLEPRPPEREEEFLGLFLF